MKKILTSLCLTVACLSVATPALCAIKTATFQTSLTILESCRVDGSRGAPVVSCQMASNAHVAAAPAMTGATPIEGTPAWLVEF